MLALDLGLDASFSLDAAPAVVEPDSVPPSFGALVWRPALYSRHGVMWASARAWSAASKREDLAALREAKRQVDPAAIEAAAGDLVRLAGGLLGGAPALVTSVACGHSRREDCFGKRLAQAVAMAIGAPSMACFGDRFVSGASHPKENRKLPPLEWIARPPAGLTVLVDRCRNVRLAHARGALYAAQLRRARARTGVDLGIMRVAIVGSRTRTDRAAVVAAVDALPCDAVVISGGCRGVDIWAAETARGRGLAVVEHLPDLAGVRGRGEASRRYHERNQRVVDDSDRVIAFVSDDRSGGTEDTIRRATKAGKPVEIL